MKNREQLQAGIKKLRRRVGAKPRKRCDLCGKIVKNRPPQARYCLDHGDREARRRAWAALDPEYAERQRERLRRHYHKKVSGRWKDDPEFRAHRAEIRRASRERRKDDPEFREREAARSRAYRERRKDDPEFREREAARSRERRKAEKEAKQS